MAQINTKVIMRIFREKTKKENPKKRDITPISLNVLKAGI